MNYFWNSDLMQEETVLFVARKNGGAPEGRLLEPAKEFLKVTNYSRTIVYEENKDFVLAPDRRTLRLTPNSQILALSESELRRTPWSPKSYTGKNGSEPWFLYSEDDFYPIHQPRFTYRHAGWTGPVPESFATNLPNTHRKLKEKSVLKLVLFGDSISEGSSASEYCKFPPGTPTYGRQVADNLTQICSSPVIFRNVSKGGMDSRWGLANVDRVLNEKPDLLILAWGMNDASGDVSEADYIKYNTGIMEAVRKLNPKVEFVMVATKYANPEWTYSNPPKYKEYLHGLKGLVGPGVALADLTSMWEYFLTKKSYLDMTGNGLNHPNDFGHSIYAQVITRTILG
jgi:lysophospholipase L1-like esterase